MLERKPHVSDADWRQYDRTMDAITTRNPERVTNNCVDMLTAKCWQIGDAELQADAFVALRNLIDEMMEVQA
ncbi:MAG: hypothetical protein IJ087_01340 [Eggerthellaceae bacterium]|nr:hypothetical protein [Eggerthellaceae bacterium]